MIIDCHAHLWKTQNGKVSGREVFSVGNGKSNFGGEIRQMMPPYMTDGENTAERFIANMDYASVSGAVITQEEIDGNQDAYLLSAKGKYPERLKICSLYEENKPFTLDGFDGVKICAGRLPTQDLTKHYKVFEAANKENKFISVDLADGDRQTASLLEMIEQFPDLKIAIGHFGMVTRKGWTEQIKLARNENVRIESGGITWLFNSEFYPYPSAVKAVKEAAEICGIHKLMWGSDYPRTMVEITYKMSYDFILKSKELTEQEKNAFLCENAQAFYGFSNLTECVKIKNMLED
ncbi:MAG: amidohydrolase family protein [Clostridia bacterium]|nr:amidohydrolase family protein [Clostridia bacterium]